MATRKSTVLRSALLSAVLVFSWSAPLSRAHADIVVDGADPTWNENIQEWCDQHIPEPFRAQNRIQVRLLNDQQMTEYLNPQPSGGDSDNRQPHQSDQDTSDIDGVFEDGPPRVTLRLSGAQMPDMFTFAHEYGHYVWFDIFSSSDRKRYESVYKRDKAQHHLVTAYASTSLEEGFAEAFSFYVNSPAMLGRRDSESRQFLDAWLADHNASDRRA
jgi:hypothetical protein